ncbi:MAG TPA: hypothetical protein VFW00_06570, partial [Rhodocyclaceae bacterium]|nr:hypothetical protein [Rhodocyclaceae bacterium]
GWKEGTFSEDQMTTYAREAVRAAISAAPVPDQQSKPDSRFDPMEEDDWDKLAELRSALEVVTRLPHTVFQFAILRIARLSSELAAASAVPAQADTWRPMETAPKDGTMLRLLVAFTDHQTEDTAEPCPTIGANSFDSTDIDQWQFAGWNWQQDCFTEGRGTPVGWLPLAPATPAVQGAETPKGGA